MYGSKSKLIGLQIVFLILAMILIAACEDGKLDSSGGAGGSVVGNGNLPDAGPRLYSNELMGVNFSYPRNWNIEEAQDRTRVALSAPTELSPVEQPPNSGGVARRASRIEFEILNQLDGVRFNSEAELMSHLRNREPNLPWQEARFIGRRNGLWHQSETVGRRHAEYFVIDENLNVLRISYEGTSSFDGLATIDAIIRDMTIDDEAPVVERIFFEPAQAKAGETVKVVVIARDELSGVEPLSMKGRPMAALQVDLRDTVIGFNIPYARYRPGLAQAFPVNGDFIAKGDSRYEYEFRIPETVPAGELVVASLFIKDRKGNGRWLSLNKDPGHNDLYSFHGSYYDISGSYVRTLTSIRREGVAVEQENGVGDTTPPVLNSVRFDRSLLTRTNPIQRIYLRLSDDSSIRANAFVDTTPGCAQAKTELVPVAEDPGLYYIELDASYCFRSRDAYGSAVAYHEGTGLVRLVYLSQLRVFDSVGNQLHVIFPNGPFAATWPNSVRFELER